MWTVGRSVRVDRANGIDAGVGRSTAHVSSVDRARCLTAQRVGGETWPLARRRLEDVGQVEHSLGVEARVERADLVVLVHVVVIVILEAAVLLIAAKERPAAIRPCRRRVRAVKVVVLAADRPFGVLARELGIDIVLKVLALVGADVDVLARLQRQREASARRRTDACRSSSMPIAFRSPNELNRLSMAAQRVAQRERARERRCSRKSSRNARRRCAPVSRDLFRAVR